MTANYESLQSFFFDKTEEGESCLISKKDKIYYLQSSYDGTRTQAGGEDESKNAD
jgi:hypothetical protein